MTNSQSQSENKNFKKKVVIWLIIVIIIIILLLLRCCGARKEEPVIENKPQTSETIEEKAGGYIEAEDKTITPELKELFDKATAEITDIKYEPIELVATQVVAGTNYKFLAMGTDNTDPTKKQKYYVTIYKDLQDNVTVVDVEPITEDDETVNKKTIVVDDEKIKSMYFYAIFYDQYGNVLQEEVLKYGTTPSYKGYLPEGFDNWDKALKPITGNTYYHAICHEVYRPQEEHSAPTDPVSEYGFYTNSLYSQTYAGGKQIDAIFTTYVDHNTSLLSNGYKQALIATGPAPNANKNEEPRQYLRCSYEVNTNTNPKTITIYTDPTNHEHNVLTIEIGDTLKLKDFPIQEEDLIFNQPTQQFRNFFSVNQEEGYAYAGNQMIWLLKKEKTIELKGNSNITKIGRIQYYGEYFSRHLDYANTIKFGPLITEIGINAFSERSIGTLDFSNASNLETIGSGAFSSCGSITTLILPNSLRYIDSKAFVSCGNIDSLTLNDGLKRIGASAFESCSKIKSITIPSSVEIIQKGAFSLIQLESLSFDGTPSIKEIGSRAFNDKDETIQLTIPASVEKLGLACFNNFRPSYLTTTGMKTDWLLYDGTGGQPIEFDLNDNDDLADFLNGITGDTAFSKAELYNNNEEAYFEIKHQVEPVR